MNELTFGEKKKILLSDMEKSNIKILNTEDSLNLIKSGKSIARLGDGELDIIKGKSFPFQRYNQDLTAQLVEILGKKQDFCLVGIPDAINNFDNLDTHNLLFIGNTGLGKTFMSNCIANELIKRGKTVFYQTSPVLLETIIDNKFNRYKDISKDNFYKNVLESDLLIIDDLGTECLNSMKLSELFTILNTRLLNLNNKSTKTIISTNLDIDNIFNNYEERIGSRIAGFYDIYYFFGDDLRFKKNQS